MKTRGVEVYLGAIVMPFARSVPEAFWARLKHHIAKAQLLDAFRADFAAERQRLEERLRSDPRLDSAVESAEAEERLFRRWTERVVGPQAIWPWEQGWTEDMVDPYLAAPVARAA